MHLLWKNADEKFTQWYINDRPNGKDFLFQSQECIKTDLENSFDHIHLGIFPFLLELKTRSFYNMDILLQSWKILHDIRDVLGVIEIVVTAQSVLLRT